MAFVQSPIPEEQQNQLGQTGTTSPNPMSMLPPQAAQTGGSAGQGGSNTPGAPSVGTSTQFGSNASRLSDYLKANQDQVQQMANQVSGQMGTNYGNVKSGIDTAGQTFGSQVSAGYTPTDPTLLSQVSSNPTSAASNPDSVSSFHKQLNDSYTGPTSFEGSDVYANTSKSVNDAVQQASLLNTYPGLSTYLQNNIETNATPGQNTLDTVLLQGNMPAFKTVQDAAKPFQNLTGYLSDAAKTGNQSVQSAQAAAPAARQAAQTALNTATGNLSSDINKRLSDAESQYVQNENVLNDYIGKLQQPGIHLTTPQMRSVGIDPTMISLLSGTPSVITEMQNAWANLPELNGPPGSSDFTYPTMGAGPTAATVATPENYATLAALSTLAGNQPITAPISADQASMGGSYTPGSYLPVANNQKIAQDLMNELSPWQAIPGATPIGNAGSQQLALSDYSTLLNSLASYLGLPPVNQNFPTAPPPAANQPPPSGPPFLGI